MDNDLVRVLLLANGALSSAVVFLFVTWLKMYSEIKADLRACEQHKTEMLERLLVAIEKREK